MTNKTDKNTSASVTPFQLPKKYQHFVNVQTTVLT